MVVNGSVVPPLIGLWTWLLSDNALVSLSQMKRGASPGQLEPDHDGRSGDLDENGGKRTGVSS